MQDKCQYIGPEQKNPPFKVCGCLALTGKRYCHDHLWKVYQRGTNVGSNRKVTAEERRFELAKDQAETSSAFE